MTGFHDNVVSKTRKGFPCTTGVVKSTRSLAVKPARDSRKGVSPMVQGKRGHVYLMAGEATQTNNAESQVGNPERWNPALCNCSLQIVLQNFPCERVNSYNLLMICVFSPLQMRECMQLQRLLTLTNMTAVSVQASNLMILYGLYLLLVCSVLLSVKSM